MVTRPKSLAEIMGTEGRNTPFAPIPDGGYLLEVVKAEYHPSEEITTGKRAGEMSNPRVQTELKVLSGVEGDRYANRRIFYTFWIQPDDDVLPFLVEGYRRLAGGQLGDGLGDPPTEDELAEQFAAGIAGGATIARVRTRKDRNGDDRTVIAAWADQEG